MFKSPPPLTYGGMVAQKKGQINFLLTLPYVSVDELAVFPVGSIIPWVDRLNSDNGEHSALPDGWIKCDGGIVPDGSIWSGLEVPDLNGKGLFLRGGSGSNVLKEEESQMKDHHHQDNGHSHTCTGIYIALTFWLFQSFLFLW